MQREATAMTVRQNLGELLNEVQYKHDEVVITKAGKPVAAMIDIALTSHAKKRKQGRLRSEVTAGLERHCFRPA